MWGMTFEKSLRMFSTADDVKRLNDNATDAARYRWLRAHASHIMVGLLSRDGDSLADISAERADFLIDRMRATDSGNNGGGNE